MNDMCENCLAELTPQDVQEDLQCEECDRQLCSMCYPVCDECMEELVEAGRA